MKKRFLGLLIGACSLTLALGAFAACDNTPTGPSLQYRLDGDAYTVVGIGTYEDGELIIPDTYNGKPVTTIAALAFSGNKEIGIVEIPDSITLIEDKAFASCTRLESVTMGDGVTSIGKEAFAYCDSLKMITLSDSLTKIDDKAFYYCRKLQAISFPDTLEVIGKSAFEGKSDREVHNNLTTVNFGTGLRSIGEKAFYNCANLLDVIIPDGAPTTIGKGAFLNCRGVRVVDLGDNVLSIGESAFSADEFQEGGHLCLREVIIGDKVHTIGAQAFQNCRKLSSVTLGKGVQTIGENAFYKCQVLREVINESNLTISVGSDAHGCVAQNAWDVRLAGEKSKISYDEQGLVYYNEGSNKILISVILEDSTDIVIPDDVTEIAKYACYAEDFLTGVVIGNGCTKVGSKAFGNCYNMRTLKLGNALTTIDDYAFYNNVALYSVVFGPSVKTVGEGAFLKKDGWDGFRTYRIYFLGTKAQWDAIDFVEVKNEHLLDPGKGGKIGFYSENEPTDTNNLYWRYVNGFPKYWE